MKEEIHRRSIRLKNYDYSQPGAYFVTVCTKGKEFLLGNITNEEIQLSPVGNIVEKCWMELPNHFDNVELDEAIIMPNHFHGIIVLTENSRGVQLNAPTKKRDNSLYSRISPRRNTLPIIIRTFKGAVKMWCNHNGMNDFQWQRNYYEHIIRNDKEFKLIGEYIINNPLRWQYDQENPDGSPDEFEKEFWRFLPDNVGAFN